MSDPETAAAIEGLVTSHQTEFWRLLEGTGTPEERDEALKVFVIEAWRLGYRKGLRRGSDALAEELRLRLVQA